jgi:hypothetical protein
LSVAAEEASRPEVPATEQPPTSVRPSGQVLLGQNIFFGKQRYFCYVCYSIGDHQENGRGPDLSQLPELASRANHA